MGMMEWFSGLRKLVAVPTPEEATNPKFLKGLAYGMLALHLVSKKEAVYSKISGGVNMVTGMVKGAVQPMLDKFEHVKNAEQIGEVIGGMVHTTFEQEEILRKMPQAEKTVGP